MHRYLLHNGQILDTSNRTLAAGQVGLLSGWGVFTTIKVVDGVLFAWERHWARMMRDARLMNVPMPPDPDAVHRDLLRLVEHNECPNATMRVVVVRNNGGMWQGPSTGRDHDVIALTAALKNWGRSVKLDFVPHARHAASPFSGTKILSWSMNLTWIEAAQSRGFDEVVLLNERGEVAECTSANIFAAFGNEVRTPPISAGCLPGITREVLVSEVHVEGIRIVEQTLMPQDLMDADEVFITSTTRDLLAVSHLGDRSRDNRGHTREGLSAAFGRYIDAYVESKKVTA
jgi:branched-chain amino acid aminotransferase